MRSRSWSIRRASPRRTTSPPQYNQIENAFPFTFMGLEPGTTKDDVRRCLEDWSKGDNGILFLSRAYRLQPGTGWQINPGFLHAPGSLVTYEPQVNSDVFAMFQSLGRWTRRRSQPAHEGCQARVSQRPRLPRQHARLGRNVNPEFGMSNRVFPRPAAVSGRNHRGWLPRAVGVSTARRGTRPRS
jgi:hypothetical protein